MERHEQAIPNEMNIHRETVPIHEARFLDPLEQEYEDYWTLLASTADQGAVGHLEIMNTVWSDETLPRAFRDRAMIVRFGNWDCIHQLGIRTLRGAGFARLYGEKPSAEENQDDVYEWLNGVHTYQLEQGAKIVPEQTLLRFWCAMYENEYIDQEDFEQKVASINNLLDALPKEDAGGNPYLKSRFPLVDEIFNGPMGSGFGSVLDYGTPRLKAWGREQLNRWLAKQADETVDVPAWYAKVSSQAVIWVLQGEDFSWEDRWPFIQQIGWQGWFTGTIDPGKCALLLDEIPNNAMKVDLLRFTLDSIPLPERDDQYSRFSGHHAGPNSDPREFIDRLLAHAKTLGDSSIVERLEFEKQHIIRSVQYWKLEDERRKKEREEQYLQSEEYQKRVVARIRISELLAKVREKYIAETNTA